MDRIINIKVFGNHMTKDNNKAGTRGETNATKLRIAFDDGWYDFEKEVIFWDAYGQNPVKRMITTDLLEDADKSTSIYLVTIPSEAMARAGELTFSIRGTLGGVRQVAITGKLEVDDSPDYIAEPIEIPEDVLTQMQTEIESIKDGIQGMAEAKAALEGIKDTAKVELDGIKDDAETYKNQANDYASNAQDYSLDAQGYSLDAKGYAESAVAEAEFAAQQSATARIYADRAWDAIGKTPYVGANGNWYVWDGEKNEFYDTEVKAQAGSEVYFGSNPPAEADVWIDPDGVEADVTTEMIVDGAITNAKIAPEAVTARHIQVHTIAEYNLSPGSITEEKIVNGAVTTEKIANGAVTSEKIADGAITTSGIANLAVTTRNIAIKAVTSASIADSAVINAKIKDGAITTEKLSDDVLELIGENNLNLENGTGVNSIQQPPETYSWGATNTRITEFLEKVGYENSKGVAVRRDSETGQFIVGAFGANSAMFGAKGQTIGGKTINGGSKNLSFENNCFNFGNGTFTGGEHAGALNNETAALANSALAVNNGTTARGLYSFSANEFTEANGKGSSTRGYKTKGNGDYTDASGVGGEANGLGSHKEGGNNISDGEYSHTENTENIASNVNTHSEGYMTIAGGEQGHSQNTRTIAGIRGFNIVNWADSGDIYVTLDSTSGLEAGDVVSVITNGVYLDCATIKARTNYSVTFSSEFAPIFDKGLALDSFGNIIQGKLVNTLFVRKKPSLGTKAVGHHTHSEGYGTVASTDCQHVQGQYNIIDTEGNYLDIVGNGNGNEHRSNAYTLDKKGNAYFAGSVDVNAVIFRSSTSGSTKRFKLTIDDSKSLKVVEVNANGDD